MAKSSEFVNEESSEDESSVSSIEDQHSSKEPEQSVESNNHGESNAQEDVAEIAGLEKVQGKPVLTTNDLKKESNVFLVRLPPGMSADQISQLKVGSKPTVELKQENENTYQIREESTSSVRVFLPDEQGSYTSNEIKTGYVITETPKISQNIDTGITIPTQAPLVPQRKNLRQHFRPIGDAVGPESEPEAEPKSGIKEHILQETGDATVEELQNKGKEKQKELKKGKREKKDEEEKPKKKKQKKSSKKEKN
ncbi:DNA-directed RNA polymerase I complex subunit Rpa34 [Schizosaccharomyces pombe]|uniref:DNA-directed RNA polymerase I subunit rpa34 n=1 Tax=Schizosaccharomyces pombe (strain 972 / ATCC 24843) TaxID=284812 RepID=RPA34_SCHPO|nr:putative DNA-directed RNA polymerase I complex subunit Rpa34 [Schizosaccharomyces pombe]Q9USZ4.1 RecName: Full=DNA-directed RNA polymerase I subunit rpa34; Short=RNA polymerase I subunit A34 [Schizosaccharomyces pombe 972h-]CAB59807.1 DNA-directed RNA polymerase I complex subunit Rpa34 (predicted) [Schizosaccharomyces pombe]|eukprot:NP_595723.1 putative DNA-directed RNA polymerase I complex subunit Rpa34 [Schizosaccharomyces pombe]